MRSSEKEKVDERETVKEGKETEEHLKRKKQETDT